MTITTISSRQFNQDTGGAKKATDQGPVIITDRGRPSHVLLSYADYVKLTGAKRSLLDVVAESDEDASAFDPPRMSDRIFRPAEFE